MLVVLTPQCSCSEVGKQRFLFFFLSSSLIVWGKLSGFKIKPNKPEIRYNYNRNLANKTWSDNAGGNSLWRECLIVLLSKCLITEVSCTELSSPTFTQWPVMRKLHRYRKIRIILKPFIKKNPHDSSLTKCFWSIHVKADVFTRNNKYCRFFKELRSELQMTTDLSMWLTVSLFL